MCFNTIYVYNKREYTSCTYVRKFSMAHGVGKSVMLQHHGNEHILWVSKTFIRRRGISHGK
jgi:hypothetical protein